MNRRLVGAAFALATSMLPAGELPLELQAKFIKIILSNAQSAGKVAIKDATLTGLLGGLGVVADPGSKVAYGASEGDLAAFKGKLIICPKEDLLSKGASIAIIEEGGKPAIYLHMQNINASGVALSEAILKIGKLAK